jgi:hypothetical protein
MAPNAQFIADRHRALMVRIGHLLARPCGFCGAKIGEPCRSKGGAKLYQISMMHDDRLTKGNKSARYRRFKDGNV